MRASSRPARAARPAALACVLALGALSARAQIGAGPAEQARALQDYGLPPFIYTQDPTRLSEAQEVVRLYSLETSSPTPVGAGLLAVLDAMPEEAVERIARKKLYMLLALIQEELTREENPGYQAHPDLLAARRRRIEAVVARQDRDGGGPAGLGKSAQPLRDVLAERQALLGAAIRSLDSGPASEGRADRVAAMRRAYAEMSTLRMEGGGPPLIPSTLTQLFEWIPEERLTQNQWRTLIESYPMGKSIWADRMDRLWRQRLDGEGVTIAVLDVGVDKDHPFLAGRVFDGGNFANQRYVDHGRVDASGGDLFGRPDNRGAHGTFVASIGAAYAPKATIVNVVVSENEAADSIPAERRLDNWAMVAAVRRGLESVYSHNEAVAAGREKTGRIDIVNLSYGLPASNAAVSEPGNLDEISVWVKKLIQSGVIVVVAAGNEAFNISRPASVPEALTVGAVDYFRRVTTFSGSHAVLDLESGATVDKPDVWSYGQSISAALYDPATNYRGKGADGLSALNWGTSFAAPHVAGAAALLVQEARRCGVALTGAMLKAVLQESADPLANGNPYARAESGVLNPNNALAVFRRMFVD